MRTIGDWMRKVPQHTGISYLRQSHIKYWYYSFYDNDYSFYSDNSKRFCQNHIYLYTAIFVGTCQVRCVPTLCQTLVYWPITLIMICIVFHMDCVAITNERSGIWKSMLISNRIWFGTRTIYEGYDSLFHTYWVSYHFIGNLVTFTIPHSNLDMIAKNVFQFLLIFAHN